MDASSDVHVNDHLIPNSRRPVVISDDRIATGTRATPIRHDDPEALLRQYLRLIRRARSQRTGRSIALRRADIETIAEHLGWTADQVLERLADLTGATTRQRSAMLAVLATGASLVTIAGSPSSAAADDAPDAMPIIVVHDELPITGATTSRAARHAPVVAPSMPDVPRPRIGPDDGAPGFGGQVLDEPVGVESGDTAGDETVPPTDEGSVEAPDPTTGDDATVAVVDLPVPSTDEPSEPSETVEVSTPDGSRETVAVAGPPVPSSDAPSETGEVSAPDGSRETVAVGRPPTRPTTSSPTDVDDDATDARPPVPPASPGAP
jgi:hypothetical protein